MPYQPGGCGCCSGSGPGSCSPCPIPANNLTLNYVNALIGNGSAPLVYSAGSWATGCLLSNSIQFALACVGGLIQLVATYYLSGVCPSGQAQSCISPGSNPFTFTLSSYQCSPFQLVYAVTSLNCPVLWSNGYTQFTITNP